MLTPLVLACAIAAADAGWQGPAAQPPRLVLPDDEADLEEALEAQVPPGELRVRVEAFNLPADDPSMVRVLVLAAVEDAGEGPTLASVAFALEGESGTRQAFVLRRGELRAGPDHSLAFTAAASVPPGTYKLRLAVLRNLRIGAADARVLARLQPAASFRLGDLLLTEGAGDVMANLSPGRRLHPGQLVATLPLEVREAAAADLEMRLEVAKDASSSALLSAPISLLPGQGSLRFGQAIADTRVLPPGSYSARVVVAAPGTEAVSVLLPFVLEEGKSPVATPSGGATAALGGIDRFELDEVLQPSVTRSFIDRLAGRAPGAAEAFQRGLSLLADRKLQSASDAFHEALAAAPDAFGATFYIGACYAAGGRDAEAASAWQTSLVGLEDQPIVFRLLADALLRSQKPDAALAVLDEAASRWPADTPFRVRQASAALAAHRYDRVAAVVDASMEAGSSEPELLLAGMQAIFEQVSAGAPGDGMAAARLERLRRYRQAYAAAGGTRQALVDEWVAAVERKVAQAPR